MEPTKMTVDQARALAALFTRLADVAEAQGLTEVEGIAEAILAEDDVARAALQQAIDNMKD